MEISLSRQQIEAAARYIGEHMLNAHRGAILLGGTVLTFGDDSYSEDERVRRYVGSLYTDPSLEGMRLGPPVCLDGHTWLIAIDGGESASLGREAEDIVAASVWAAWSAVCGGASQGYQLHVARAAIDLHRRSLHKLLGQPVPRKAEIPATITPGGRLLIGRGTGERVRILVGGIPYAAILPEIKTGGVKPEIITAVLLEHIGDPTADVGNEADRCFPAGSILFGVDSNQTHGGTGERLLDSVWDTRDIMASMEPLV